MTDEELQAIRDRLTHAKRPYLAAGQYYQSADAIQDISVLLAEVTRLSKALVDLQELYTDRDNDLAFEYERANKAEARIERLIAQTGGGTAAARTTPGQFSRMRARLVIDAEELPY